MNKNYYKDITIILVAYKSSKKIINIIRKIPKKLKIIVVDNSNDLKLKKKIKKRFKNTKFFLKKNKGVSSSINFAVNKVRTKYFFQISPDIVFDFKNLNKFWLVAKDMKNNFSALGPRFVNVNEKSHKQSNTKFKIREIKSIHGSAMFINKKIFQKIGKFDENFFLYFEETDYCKRGKMKGLKSYQLNNIKVKQIGRSVNIINVKEKLDLEKLLAWHFIWSKFYYFRKHYGILISLIYFVPIIIRTVFKKIFYKLTNHKSEYYKYRNRYNGLKAAITGKKSYLRPNF